MAKNKKSNTSELPYTITEDGSLGLLATGDVGFRAWREVKNKSNIKNMINEEE